MVEPQAPRFTVEGGVVRIPAPRNRFLVLFMTAFAGVFAVTLANIFRRSLAETREIPWQLVPGFLVLLLWLAPSVLWPLFGRELIGIESGVLEHRVEILGVGRTRSYDCAHLARLRSVDYSPNSLTNPHATMLPLFGEGHGPIAFDYGARTVRMGAGLSEAEGHAVVEFLAKSLPRAERPA